MNLRTLTEQQVALRQRPFTGHVTVLPPAVSASRAPDPELRAIAPRRSLDPSARRADGDFAATAPKAANGHHVPSPRCVVAPSSPAQSFAYEHTDIEPGKTHREWARAGRPIHDNAPQAAENGRGA